MRQAPSTESKFIGLPGQYFDQETDLHYNYFRDYDPATGRYIQSDPIGLNGGNNTYNYAGANSIISIDPLGLIIWEGQVNVYDVGIYGGVAHLKAELTSECIDGEQYTVFVRATFVGINIGILPFSFSISDKQKFDDGLPMIDPNVFNGWAFIGIMGAQSGQHGGSLSDIKLGGARTPVPKHYGDLNISGGDGIAEGLLGMVGRSAVEGTPYSMPCNKECK